MHSRLRYKICICLVIQGELNFSKLQGLQYYFPQNFRCKLLFYESENFSDSSLHHIVEFENFYKNRQTWGVKFEKLNVRKSQGINQISFENGT